MTPAYKEDPGPTFPWRRFADLGITPPWPDPERVLDRLVFYESALPDPAWFQRKLAEHGYPIDADAPLDKPGQRKLLELCRALMVDPKIILLDEPGAGVSPVMRVQISDVIKSLRDEGVTFVIIEHDMDMIARLCDRVYVFAEGKNLTDGSFSDIVADKRVIDAYLGGIN